MEKLTMEKRALRWKNERFFFFHCSLSEFETLRNVCDGRLCSKSGHHGYLSRRAILPPTRTTKEDSEWVGSIWQRARTGRATYRLSRLRPLTYIDVFGILIRSELYYINTCKFYFVFLSTHVNNFSVVRLAITRGYVLCTNKQIQ